MGNVVNIENEVNNEVRTYEDIFTMDNYRFLKWLKVTFPIKLLPTIKTMDDMERAGELMIELSSQYSYISEISSYAKVYCRSLKRLADKENPETIADYEDMVDKKEAVEAKMKAIHQAYCGVSRAITVKMENNNELRMTGNRYVNIA